MTRTLKQRESDGKPLPSALMDPIPEWVDEETVADRVLPLAPEEIDAHLEQMAEAGQGDDHFSYRSPL